MNLHPLTQQNIDMDRFEVFVMTESGIERPMVVDRMEIEMSAELTCSVARFSVYHDDQTTTDIDMGDLVRMQIDGEDYWYGYIFKSGEDKDGIVELTAYDQIRYLKAKDTYQYENLRYSDLVKRIAEDRNLILGEVESSNYLIAMRIEEDKEYLEMLQNASDETTAYEGHIYVLYDNAGKLCLKNIKNMKVNDVLINERTGENYQYEVSIDDNTYNRIKVDVVQEDLNIVEPVIVEDAKTMAKWGTLQWYAQTTEPIGQVRAKAKQLLEALNKKTRGIRLDGVFGHKEVRGGSLIPVQLKLRDIKIDGYMMVQSVTHYFSMGVHTMDLVLHNKDFMPLVNTDNVFLYEKKQADSATGGSMEGSTIHEQIWSFFKSRGYSDGAIAGIMGNIAQESGFRLDAVGDSGTSYGLVQWHAGRWEALKNYANARGKPMDDLQTQLEFIDKELRGMSGGSNFMKMTDPSQASDWFTTYYERPNEAMANRPYRRSQAEQFASRFKDWTPSTASSGTGSPKVEHILREAIKFEGFPYSQTNRMGNAVDCSSLVDRALRNAGLPNTMGRDLVTANMDNDPRFYRIPLSQARRGDVLHKPGHVAFYLGDNQTFEAFDYGVPTGYGKGKDRFTSAYRIKGT